MSWIAVAIGGSALVGGGAAIYSASKGGKNEFDFGYKELPGYGESDAARGEWWNRLQEWGKQPGYGAISPAWEDTWNLAKQKLSQYYWGGVNDTGLAGKVRASAARRNVSQSPALENMLGTMGMQEAQDVSGLASTEAINKAQFAETGRQNWLTSLMNLTQQRPAYVTASGVSQPTYNAGNMVSDIAGGLGGIFQQYAQQEYLTKQNQQQQDWMTNLLKQYSSGGSYPLSSSYGAASPQIGYGGISGLDTSKYPNLFGGS